MAGIPEYVWQGLGCEDLLMTVGKQQPPAYPWGFYASDDFVLSSAGVHLWFGSLDELCVFLVEGEALVYELEGDELKEIGEELRPIAEQIARGELSLTEAIAPLNQALKGLSCIEWIGTFQELATGNTEYAHLARMDYLGCDEESPLSAVPVIPEDGIGVFAEFISSWRL